MIALAALCPLTVFAVSPVHNRVIDYVPAPGQFVNELPEWEDGDDSEAMAAKALQYMTEEGYYISLGAWGGYVTVGFERTIGKTRHLHRRQCVSVFAVVDKRRQQ